ncbi:hypothetical protein SAMN04489761_3277 [Tenacibaculum sp. MAR_2009_124]|nr:hypothetical protein SAMN04489761_3277 [Tenacibaculum sp. MAR_2009_124]
MFDKKKVVELIIFFEYFIQEIVHIQILTNKGQHLFVKKRIRKL